LYHLLFGEPAFDGISKQEVMDKIVKGEYAIKKNIAQNLTKSVVELISQMINVNWKNRVTLNEI